MKSIKIIAIVLFLVIAIPMNYFSLDLFGDEGTCEPDPPDPGPGNDHADDNYSYFTGIVKVYNLAPEAVIFTIIPPDTAILLQRRTNSDEAENLKFSLTNALNFSILLWCSRRDALPIHNMLHQYSL